MSSLIFYTEENQVLVATDTLTTSPDGRPFKYATKAFVVPHLRMIIAGTGAGGFLGRWFVQINDRMVVRGIDHLDYHVPGYLASIWPGCKQEFSFPDGITATIYHFGFSEDSGLIHAFAYRSTNNFQSERIEYGLGIKPQCTVSADYRLPQDIRTMMDAQRASQTALPEGQRAHIGGEIQVHQLTKKGFFIYTLGRFEDYDRDEEAIYENYRDAKNGI
jgi:hypothetical protein